MSNLTKLVPVDELDRLNARIEELERERDEARKALYPIVCELLTADAREDAPEIDGSLMEAGMRALPACGSCNGHGSADGLPHEDEERELCDRCGGWGFLGPQEGYVLKTGSNLVHKVAALTAQLAAAREAVKVVEAHHHFFDDVGSYHIEISHGGTVAFRELLSALAAGKDAKP